MERKNKLLSIGISIILICVVLPVVAAFAGNPPDAGNSSLVATSPGSNEVPANGQTTASLTLTLKDSSGTPLAGDTVSLSAPSDSTAVFNPTSTTLDASGIATFSATSTQVGTDSINVTDSTTSTTLPALGQAIFDAVPTSPPSNSSSNSCGNAFPPNAPNLYQVSINQTDATLYFVQPSLPFDGYTISYGLTKSANTYNVSFSQGPSSGAIQYTIHDLIPKAVYYFMVRANNGCAPGPWSPVRSSSTVQTLPVTGSENTFILLGVGGVLSILTGFALFFVM